MLIMCCYQLSFAQENKGKRQTDAQKKDSLEMYRNIENYSRKRGFTRFLHKLIFRPVTAKQKIKKNSFQKIKKKPLLDSEGKIIRKILITTLDPFGYSEIDSTKKPTRWLDRTGNMLHNKTSNLAIRNLLLLKKNRPLDSLLVKESERLIRSQRYVRSVVITSEPIKGQDSVDVYVRVLDAWSTIPDFSASGSRMSFKLNERNFLGTGHQFENTYKKSLGSNEDAFSTLYVVPNILNTYIKTSVSYQEDLDGNIRKFADVERPFFSALTRWAAGIHVENQFNRAIEIDLNKVETYQIYKFNSYDFWAGHAYQIFKGTSEKSRTTNLITTARFFNVDYLQGPSIVKDSLRIFSDEKLYLIGIGISSRQFVQDKYLLNYQVVEDVPTGIVYGLTAGHQSKNGTHRLYFGGRFAIGKYFKFGYLSTNIEYGSFYRQRDFEQSAIAYNLVYFTNLLERGRWKFRQFIKPELIIGNSRLQSDADRLTLNDAYGIQGFNSNNLFGTKKLLVNFQTQAYSPWNFWGFRLNPYLSYTMGMLGDAQNGLRSSRVYSQIGAGIIISNDYLVFSSFQISFSYYPSIPGVGNSILKTNAYKTSDFDFQNFELAKPTLVPYQ
ncbi:hypothetical protein [Flavobacterium noncentrifugens]|uniref:Uncharacterized protein n=1 Tax=Flavobacterium noncentrifugens TaxID=1128970 RepID=A0A1G9BNW9_9FLAO|nr:hypothetical protein [Flavobacterium noncentrifugens]SDK41188.1 hypothetical protein SAMN04487935_3301 [Flavobacterium noncentrifugens]